MDHFYENLPGFFTFQDFYDSVVSRLPDRPRIVEVGCFAGRSAAYLGVELENHRGNYTLYLVDMFQQIRRTDVAKNLRSLRKSVPASVG